MKKPFKVLSATALAATFTASALIPTVAIAAEDNKTMTYEIQSLYLEHEGKHYFIDKKMYNSALINGINLEEISYIVSDEYIYPLKAFNSALLNNNNDTQEALKFLEEKQIAVQLEDTGKVEFDGKTPKYVDAQPEDRLNETFFYNVA